MSKSSKRAKFLSEDGYDAVVVGSGYGGGAAACRLAEAGIKVCLIEKGRRWEPKDFPTNILQLAFQARLKYKRLGFTWGPKNGLFQVDVQDDAVAMTICGLGGGSLSNAGVMVPTPARARRDPRWPKEWHQDWKVCEAAANAMMTPQSVPHEFGSGAVLREISGEIEDSSPCDIKVTVNFGPDGTTNPKGAQPLGTCTGCGNCLSGCPYNAKNSTDKNYVAVAVQGGCTVITECAVRYVVKNPDIDFGDDGRKHGRRWRVYLDNLEYVPCDFVVLSAGVLGTAEIMFQSERRGLRLSKRLGFGFSNNGNNVAYVTGSPAPVNAVGMNENRLSAIPFQDRPGPSISSAYTSSLGYTIQTAVIPSAYPHLAFKGFATYGWPSGFGFLDGVFDSFKSVFGVKGSNAVSLNLMGVDDADGRITFDESTGKIYFKAAHDPLLPKKIQSVQKLSKRIGGIMYMSRYRSTSVHLLGGCVAAADPSQGVCNPSGQVFDANGPPGTVHGGLYVCDASLIPCAIGINPSLTIGTVAEHVCRQLVQDVQTYKRLNSAVPEAFKEASAPVDVHDLLNRVADSVRVSEVNGKADYKVMRGDNVVMFKEIMRGFVGGMPCTAHLELKMNPSNVKNFDDWNEAAGGEPHPLLRGKVGGYVEFKAVDNDKLYIIDGKADLCRIDRRTPYTQYMHYYLLLASASGSRYANFITIYHSAAGDDCSNEPVIWGHQRQWLGCLTIVPSWRYILEGRKIMNPFFLVAYTLWESTTLHVTFKSVKHSSLREEPLNLTGELRLSMVDLVRSLISLRGKQKGKFVGLLLQSLSRTYITQQPRAIHEEIKCLDMNPSTYPPYINHEITTDDGVSISCKQWKCNKDAYQSNERRPSPVLMINGHSTESYWLPTEPTDLVRALLEEGFEPWLIFTRLDPAYAATDFSFDDIAKFDIPAVLKKIIEVHGPSAKVHLVAHCVGGLQTHIALMGGHISATQIASVSCTSSSMFFRVTKSALFKMYIPLIPIAIALLGRNKTAPVFSNPNDAIQYRFWRFASKQVPRYERCTCEECEVFSGIFGNTFWHDNISPTMHQILKEKLPRLPMAAFPQLAKICRAGHIVDAKGQNTYLIHPERMAVPTLYISGGRNLLVTQETSFLANRFMKLHHPGLTHRRVVVDGLGHSDLLIGVESPKKVFPHIISHIKEADQAQGKSGSTNGAEESKVSKESLAWAESDAARTGGPDIWAVGLVFLFLAFVAFFVSYLP
ncbi:hypothetical protein ACLOJK_005887 [Asimina triloba]